MRSSGIADAIIFTRRDEVARFALDNFKIKGVSNILTPEDPDKAIDAVTRFSKALLVIDWQYGEAEVVRVLAAHRKKNAGTPRPVLLIADEVSESLVATAAEYGVTQIFTEDVSFKNLGGRIASMLISESLPDELRKVIGDATTARESGDLKGAAQLLQKALGKHPQNLRLRCEAAEVLMRLDQWDKAAQLLDGLEQTKPPYLRAVHLMGRCQMKLGKFAEAVKSFETANLFNPHDADRMVDLGHAFLSLDRTKEADLHFDKALKLEPRSHEARVGKGKCKLMDGHVNDALSLMRDVAGDLELASVFNTCAVMNMRRGRFDAGMELYRSALKAIGKNPRIQARLHFNLGIGWRRKSEPQKALQAFETARKLDPAYAKAKEQLETLAAAQRAVTGRPTPVPGDAGDAGDRSHGAKAPSTAASPGVADDMFQRLGAEPDLDSLLDENLEEGLYDDPQDDRDEDEHGPDKKPAGKASVTKKRPA
jgi:tetratricopeptide (TPR) repeat protein